jgi:hypothetical protein
VGLSAVAGYAAALAIPDARPLAGLLVRGSTVLVVMATLLALSGFFRPEELRVLQGLRRRPRGGRTADAPDTIEMAGEIVATGLPDSSDVRRS